MIDMTNITAIVILCIVAAMLIAFVVAIWLSYRVNRGMQEENKHLAELLHRKAERSPLQDAKLLEAAESMQETNALPDKELVLWIVQQIEERKLYAANDTSLKTIARELGLTQKRLTEVLVLSPYGTLGELITIKRVENACRLLEEKTEWTIEAIAKEAGFTTRRTFQNLFKAHTGVTPSQYRALKMRKSEVH